MFSSPRTSNYERAKLGWSRFHLSLSARQCTTLGYGFRKTRYRYYGSFNNATTISIWHIACILSK